MQFLAGDNTLVVVLCASDKVGNWLSGNRRKLLGWVCSFQLYSPQKGWWDGRALLDCFVRSTWRGCIDIAIDIWASPQPLRLCLESCHEKTDSTGDRTWKNASHVSEYTTKRRYDEGIAHHKEHIRYSNHSCKPCLSSSTSVDLHTYVLVSHFCLKSRMSPPQPWRNFATMTADDIFSCAHVCGVNTGCFCGKKAVYILDKSFRTCNTTFQACGFQFVPLAEQSAKLTVSADG